MRTLWPVLGALALAYGLCAAWVFYAQRSQIYFPTPESAAPPAATALWVDSEGERILVWAEVRPGTRALLYFGGNAEDVAGNVILFERTFTDRSLYFVNYRGYGGSSGRPTEAGLVADALAVFDQVYARHPDVAVVGRSLGSGVAVQLAAARPVERLVLVTPYDSLLNVAKGYFRWLPVGFLMRDRYESDEKARAVSAPVLLVIAGQDEIIPRERSEALVAAFASGQVRVMVVPGVGHNTLDHAPAYLESVAAFLAEPRSPSGNSGPFSPPRP